MFNETFVTGLDDFASLFGESEARNLLELLKLSVSGRAGSNCNIQTISNTLIALSVNSTIIGNMVMETCISELEDLCTSRHCLGKLPKPIVQETSHPYIDGEIFYFFIYRFKLFVLLIDFENLGEPFLQRRVF